MDLFRSDFVSSLLVKKLQGNLLNRRILFKCKNFKQIEQPGKVLLKSRQWTCHVTRGEVGKSRKVTSITMPRSFLVKKKDDPRTYHSYKPRDHVDTSDITPESLLALTPYTPSFLPLTVRVNNGKKNTHV